MRGEASPIGEVISEWLKKQKRPSLSGKSEEESKEKGQKEMGEIIASCWEEIVGKRMSEIVRPYRFNRGILYVCTESSTWAQEFSFIKPEIVRKLNERFGRKIVADIYCRIGVPKRAKKHDRPVEGSSKMPSPSELKVIKLPTQIERYVDEKVSAIQDDELKGVIKRVFLLHMKLKLWRERHGLKRCKSCGEIYKSSEKFCPMCFAKNG